MGLYAPVPGDAAAVTRSLLDLLTVESRGFLESYYARLEKLPEDAQYDAVRESTDLKGREDLLERLQRDQNGGFALAVQVGLYPALVYVWVFTNGAASATVLLRIDPAITRSLEEEDDNRMNVVMFLTKIAAAIGSEWFISGLFIEQWRPLTLEQLADTGHVRRWGRLLVVGWKPGSPAEPAISAAIHPPSEAVKQTTVGYSVFVNFLEI